jgi:5-formyltetrahydrofolate cyclo-ligase
MLRPSVAALPTKAELRVLALARRAELSEEQRREASTRAVGRLVPLISPGEVVSLFWPMRGEVDPLGLVQHVESAGGRVAMPVVDGKRMFFRAYDGERSMEPGVFGTSHPHAGQPVLDPDFIIAPLAAFDRRGGRIGYGAGYYDKASADLKARGKAFRMAGIAFACQEVDEVPVEPHDEPLMLVATERELIQAGVSA